MPPLGLGRKMNSLHPIALLLCGMLPVVSLQAEDWPQFRGPNRDAVWKESGTLQVFPPEGLKVQWRAPIGPGFSSPVVAEGRVYITDCQLAKDYSTKEFTGNTASQ